ncbi:MAG: HAMP domain-containing protein [Anaerolineae bacterium]|nr:HAMP domain-containing protein [Anaerolineae bacterium]
MKSEKATWGLDFRKFIMMAVGILLYAGTSWVTNYASIGEGAAAGSLRPGVAVPIFFGFVYGPLVGFGVGFFGNLGFDYLQGWASLPEQGISFVTLASSLGLNWQVGNGLMGFVPGFFSLFYRRFASTKDMLRAVSIIFAAVAVGIGFAAGTDPFVYPPEGGVVDWDGVWRFVFAPFALTNFINAAVLVPILLYNYQHIDLQAGMFGGSGLVRRLLVTILISAAVPIILLTIFLVQATLSGAPVEGDAASTNVIFIQLGFTIALTAVFIISNSAMMAQSLSRPLLRLSESAQTMEAGKLSVLEAGNLVTETVGNDEIAQLTRVFGSMAKEVIEREEKLRRQVAELRIEIDQTKQREEVIGIVETDFFKDLQSKASKMRKKRDVEDGEE